MEHDHVPPQPYMEQEAFPQRLSRRRNMLLCRSMFRWMTQVVECSVGVRIMVGDIIMWIKVVVCGGNFGDF
ncbi:hypothetical protein JTE90_009592 [Oedothorax gibbosus]|nr:hypothetical protein JTE90_009592 [Oedothorax gibbosus]